MWNSIRIQNTFFKYKILCESTTKNFGKKAKFIVIIIKNKKIGRKKERRQINTYIIQL